MCQEKNVVLIKGEPGVLKLKNFSLRDEPLSVVWDHYV